MTPAIAFVRACLGVDQRLGLRHPGIGPVRQSDFLSDLVRGVVIELGELPVMEDAEIVQLILDRTRHAGELLEIVGGAARTGQTLKASGGSCRRILLDRSRGRADIDAELALRAR